MGDAHKNFAISAVATAPSPATSGTSLVVTAGHGTRFPTPPFQATIWPSGSSPDPSNAEIVRVTAISTDTLTITRAQESTVARTVVVGDQIAATITADMLTEVESAVGMRVSPKLYNDFLNTTVAQLAPFHWAAISSGTQSVVAGLSSHPGIMRMTSSTTANSGGYTGTQALTWKLLGAGDYMEAIFRINTLTNGTFRIGFHDSQSSTAPVDGAYMDIASSGVATFTARNNSTSSTAGTTATLSTATWYRIEIECRSTTDVRGRIYNSDTGAVVLAEQTLTTNIPTASGRELGLLITATNSGTTATSLIDVDWLCYGRLPGFDIVR